MRAIMLLAATMKWPSMTGEHIRSGSVRITPRYALAMSSVGMARSSSRVWAPKESANLFQAAKVAEAGRGFIMGTGPPPLSIAAPENRPSARGDRHSCCTLMAPADWPIMVMRLD